MASTGLSVDELKIFKKLDAECAPNSTPIPKDLFEKIRDVELFAIFIRFLSDSFQRMRDTDGASNWDVNPDCILGTKLTDEENVDRHHLGVFLDKLQSLGLIETAPNFRLSILNVFSKGS